MTPNGKMGFSVFYIFNGPLPDEIVVRPWTALGAAFCGTLK